LKKERRNKMAKFTSKNEQYWTKRYTNSELGARGQIFADITLALGLILLVGTTYWTEALIILGVRWYLVHSIKGERNKTGTNDRKGQ
jgi:hypothetical protein